MSDGMHPAPDAPFVVAPRRVGVVLILLMKWIGLAFLLGLVVWAVTNVPGSQPSLTSRSALLGIASGMALLALMAYRMGRIRVVLTASHVDVFNLVRHETFALTDLARVRWTRYSAPLTIWYPVVTLEVRTKSGSRSVQLSATIACPRQGGLIDRFEQLCSTLDIPCELQNDPRSAGRR